MPQTVETSDPNCWMSWQIPEAEASIQSVAIDPEGSYMAAVNNKGHCYIWSLSGGVKEEPTKLNPKQKIEAHQRYALKCKFSPDSTWVFECSRLSSRYIIAVVSLGLNTTS